MINNYKLMEEFYTQETSYQSNSPTFFNSQSYITAKREFNRQKVYCSDNFQVFERLIEDTNRRSERDLKIMKFKEEKELNSIPKFRENVQVYDRLLIDTKIRKERVKLTNKFKQLTEEEELMKFRSTKKLTKSEAEKITNRLSKFY